MGTCASDYEDDFDHTLKNKQAFSTLKNQMEAFSKEGLLFFDKDGAQDRRIKIEFRKDKASPSSFASLCQLAGSVNDSIQGVGSCCRINVKGVQCILTCAHNLVSKSTLTGKFIKHTCGYTYEMRQGENAWKKLWKLKMDEVRRHPKYNGDAAGGFDIAVCPIVGNRHQFDLKVNCSKLIPDYELASPDPADIKVGYEIEIGGYPGEKGGHAHYHRDKVVHVKNTERGGCILFYGVDTTPGNSGSPIWIVDERFLDEYRKKKPLKKGIRKLMIGIHTGHSAVDMLNYGILITPTLGKWIKGEKAV